MAVRLNFIGHKARLIAPIPLRSPGIFTSSGRRMSEPSISRARSTEVSAQRIVAAPNQHPTPPRVRLAFRVGVVGHRPDRLPQDAVGIDLLRTRLADALEAVAQTVEGFRGATDGGLYSPEAPLLRANSPLAEGTDRLFAEEALRLNYHLCCVMPFAQEEFEKDFKPPQASEPASLAHFRGLLARAEATAGLTRFEMDGDRAQSGLAYDAAGRVVVNQSDLLLIVWDGGLANGEGGTVDTLRQATGLGVPVLWIDSREPFGWKLLQGPADLECIEATSGCAPDPPPADWEEDRRRLKDAVGEVVKKELSLPSGETEADKAPQARARFSDYLGEKKPGVDFAFTWKLFRDLLDTGRLRAPWRRAANFADEIGDLGPAPQGTGADGAETSWINRALRPHYGWPDRLSERYADAHRSAVVISSLLAAGAVFVALLPMAAGWQAHDSRSVATAVVEAVALAILVGMPLMANRRRWRQRWMEYRVLAELIRELRMLVPLGGGRMIPRTPPHLASYGEPTRNWMYWHVKAVARANGLHSARVTSAYVREHLERLRDVVGFAQDNLPAGGQLGFHQLNCGRFERIHRRLHRLTLILFSITIVGVFLNWALMALAAYPQMPQAPAWAARWLILTSAFFPALGAALASINNQGEFARLQRRSRAMAEGFAKLAGEIDALWPQAQDADSSVSLAALTDLTGRAAAMMAEENVDWRIVVLDPPHAAG
jgi:hypothetical protein